MTQYYKKLFLSGMLCCCIPLIALSQVKTKYFKEGIPSALKSARAASITPHVIPAPASFDQLRTSAEKSSGEYLGRFATPVHVLIDVLKTATVVEDKRYTTYLLPLRGEKALSLSLQFGKFSLSKNAVLSIYNQYELTDSITATENNPLQQWSTRAYQGSDLTISLKIPKSEVKDNILQINKVNFGYKSFGGEFFGSPGASGSCNVNVACPAGNAWNNEKNAVALILGDGTMYCTGTMVMNTSNSNTPYLLTANHCVVEKPNVAAWVFQFQTWSNVCNGNSGWSETHQYNGSTLRASHAATDFALLELNITPSVNSGIVYAGWSRCATPAASATTIHHPAGDLMKISQDNQALVSVAWQSGASNHWRATFDAGIVQPGSSGSPLFDPSHRIVGQLHGNQANACFSGDNTCFCNQPIGEFGRFDISWTGGGTNATRLSNWLDPGNTNALTTNTSAIHRLNGLPGQFDLEGDPNLNSPTQNFTLKYNGLPYYGNVSWTSSNTAVATVSGSGHTVTVTRVGGCGFSTLTATETNCGTSSVAIARPLGVAGPQLNGFDFTKTGNPCSPSFGVTYNGNGGCALRTDANVQEVEYWFSSPYSYSINYNSGSLSCYSTSIVNKAGFTGTFPTQSQPYVVTIRFRVRNNCEWSEWSPGYYHFVQSCSFAFTVTPNPVSSRVEVALDETTIKKTAEHSIREVQISDKTGRILRQTRYGPGTQRLTLDMSGLKPDVYFLRVFDGKEWRSESVIKR